jgi:hypothetical protein
MSDTSGFLISDVSRLMRQQVDREARDVLFGTLNAIRENVSVDERNEAVHG